MFCAMESWMFKIFYMETTMEKTSHILKDGEGKQQKCVHKYAALNIKIDNLDICPLNYILRTTCILSKQEQSALKLIEEKRNTLCHAWSAKCLSTAQLSNIWNDLERAVLCLTNPYLSKIIKNEIEVIRTCDITMAEITEFTQKISRMNKVLEYRESSSGNDYDNIMVMDNTIGKMTDHDDPELKEVDKTVKIGTLEIPATVKEDKKKCEESSSGNTYDNVTDWTKHIGEIADSDDHALKEVNKPVNKAAHQILTTVNKDQRQCEENMELSSGHKYDNVTDWTKHIGGITDRNDQALREVNKTVNKAAHEIRATVGEEQRKREEVRHLIEESIAGLFQSSLPRKDVDLHPERFFNREYISRKTMMIRNKQLVIMKPVISFDI